MNEFPSSGARHRHQAVNGNDPQNFGIELCRVLDEIEEGGGVVIHLSTQVIAAGRNDPGALLYAAQVIYRSGFMEQLEPVAAAAAAEPTTLLEEQVAAIVEEVA